MDIGKHKKKFYYVNAVEITHNFADSAVVTPAYLTFCFIVFK